MLAGGKEGAAVLFGKECAAFVDDFEAFETVESILNNYKNKVELRPGSKRKKERLGEVINRLGLESFMD